ncbi:MAG: hypothetical protein J2P24_11010 [Streptosporangiales bacterium]|nr:hypothetical protein [Streptosporangiales bacterium]
MLHKILRSTLCASLVLTLAGMLLAGGAAVQAAPAQQVSVATDVDHVDIFNAPCSVGRMTVSLTNDGRKAIYADAFLDADGLDLTTDVISTYLPAGYTYTQQIQVSAPDSTDAGDHTVTVQSGSSRRTVAVHVGDLTTNPNIARRGHPTASRTYPGRPPCGAIDGNKDSEAWAQGVGWSDNTPGVYPDWWQETFDSPVTVSRVDVYSLDSVAIPASREGLRDWDIQVADGSGGWRTVASVRGSTAPMVSSTFPTETTTGIRISILQANASFSRVLELEAYA